MPMGIFEDSTEIDIAEISGPFNVEFQQEARIDWFITKWIEIASCTKFKKFHYSSVKQISSFLTKVFFDWLKYQSMQVF